MLRPPRKNKKKPVRLTNKQIEDIIQIRMGICEMSTCLEMNNLVVHHIKRRSDGGTNELSNLLVLCQRHHKLLHFKEGPKK